jgi:hypothetical protein
LVNGRLTRVLRAAGAATAAIGATFGMPAAEAVKPLRGQQGRAGNVARLRALAVELGIETAKAGGLEYLM